MMFLWLWSFCFAKECQVQVWSSTWQHGGGNLAGNVQQVLGDVDGECIASDGPLQLLTNVLLQLAHLACDFREFD